MKSITIRLLLCALSGCVTTFALLAGIDGLRHIEALAPYIALITAISAIPALIHRRKGFFGLIFRGCLYALVCCVLLVVFKSKI